MKLKPFPWFAIALLAVSGLANAAPTNAADRIEIPFQKFVLPNGLTLVVHEDHKAPIVAVNVWYHVGSKNERPGKTGFAHLFEHLMFNGSEHFNDDFFKATEKVGASEMNGTTSEDRTDYFENVPKAALDYVLWLESDRMGHLLGAVDQARLDEQRGVVQNEKRQGENRPYGLAEELITKGTYPPGHPYSWTVIGSMADLNAASLDDVREWFRTYYGPANATLVVAGDVKPESVHQAVLKYFGDIPSGPPLTRQETWIAKRTGAHRQIAQDRAPQARLYKVWNIPEWGAADGDYLNLVSDVLASGKSSRLYKRLVYDTQLASDVSAYAELNEIGGRFHIVATARPGVELAKIEAAIDEELAQFLASGPTKDELERVRTQYLAGFLRGIERIGGFGGKSDILAQSQVFGGSPDAFQKTLQRVRAATARDLQSAAQHWLADGVYVLEVHPFPQFTTSPSTVDRSHLPTPELKPSVEFPAVQRAQLSNGLKVVLTERHSVPLVNFTLQVDAGYAADALAAPGTMKMMMDMLDEGTPTRSSLQISDELERLGANLSAVSDLDTSRIALSALREKLGASFDLFADVIQHPVFPDKEFKRVQKLRLDDIAQEESDPRSAAMRVLPRLLYGDKHPYAEPFTGSGTTEAVQRLTRDDLERFYKLWFKPNNATLIIVGDTTLAEILPRLEKQFAAWKSGDVPAKTIPTVPPPAKPVVYLLDHPGAIQSFIAVGDLAPPENNPDEIAMDTMNNILGGSFTSRINMNLREDKHWSYGARSSIVPARGQRPFLVLAPVQTDKTKESLAEINRELRGIVSDHPVTDAELAKAQKDQTLKLAGAWETSAAVSRSLADSVRFGRPDDYYQTYPTKVLALKPADMVRAADEVVHPNQLVFVVVGDRAKIEAGIRELNLGEVKLLEPGGHAATGVSLKDSPPKAPARKS